MYKQLLYDKNLLKDLEHPFIFESLKLLNFLMILNTLRLTPFLFLIGPSR